MSLPVCPECGRVGMLIGWSDHLHDDNTPATLHYGCVNGHEWTASEGEDE